MVTLRDKSNGRTLGRVSEEDLQFLIDQLEEESGDDTDYYIDTDTIDMLEDDGGSATLISLLRSCVTDDAEGIDIEWVRG
jgi:hypothetical protein